jgi:hypothetical protein
VHTSHCKLGKENTASPVSYFFKNQYDAHLQDLTLSGACISHNSVV